jgi:alkylhydroperoxidase family enzyme
MSDWRGAAPADRSCPALGMRGSPLVALRPVRDTAAMSWLPPAKLEATQGKGRVTALDAVFGHRPNLYREFRDFYALFWEAGLVEPQLLELCRLRIAAMLGCASELAVRYESAREAGLDESKIAALDDWSNDTRFSEFERAALAFAEMFVNDPHAITDEDTHAVARELGDEGLVAFVEALALFDGFSRFRVMLGVAPEGDALLEIRSPRVGDPSLA